MPSTIDEPLSTALNESGFAYCCALPTMFVSMPMPGMCIWCHLPFTFTYMAEPILIISIEPPTFTCMLAGGTRSRSTAGPVAFATVMCSDFA